MSHMFTHKLSSAHTYIQKWNLLPLGDLSESNHADTEEGHYPAFELDI